VRQGAVLSCETARVAGVWRARLRSRWRAHRVRVGRIGSVRRAYGEDAERKPHPRHPQTRPPKPTKIPDRLTT